MRSEWNDLAAWGADGRRRLRLAAFTLRVGKREWASGHAWNSRFVVTAGTYRPDALAVLLHEMAHVAVGLSNGHNGKWQDVYLKAAAEVLDHDLEAPANSQGMTSSIAAAFTPEWMSAHGIEVAPPPV